MKKTATRLLIIIFLAFIIIFTVYPVLYTILGSFKTNLELQGGGKFFSSEWHFSNYVDAFLANYLFHGRLCNRQTQFYRKKSVAGHIFIRYVCSVGSNYAG